MKFPARSTRCEAGYSLMEALVYIGLVMVVVGGAYLAMYRGLDHLLTIRRNAEDIASALRVGELWRADVRQGSGGIRLMSTDAGPVLEIGTAEGPVTYGASGNSLWRVKNGGRAELLRNVKTSAMTEERRGDVLGWRWELQLQPQTKGVVKAGRVRPLFTFLAVPPQAPTP